MSISEKRVKKVSLSFMGLLTVLFISLKLTSVINWSWVWVLSPIWISVGLTLVWIIILSLILGGALILMFK